MYLAYFAYCSDSSDGGRSSRTTATYEGDFDRDAGQPSVDISTAAKMIAGMRTIRTAGPRPPTESDVARYDAASHEHHQAEEALRAAEADRWRCWRDRHHLEQRLIPLEREAKRGLQKVSNFRRISEEHARHSDELDAIVECAKSVYEKARYVLTDKQCALEEARYEHVTDLGKSSATTARGPIPARKRRRPITTKKYIPSLVSPTTAAVKGQVEAGGKRKRANMCAIEGNTANKPGPSKAAKKVRKSSARGVVARSARVAMSATTDADNSFGRLQHSRWIEIFNGLQAETTAAEGALLEAESRVAEIEREEKDFLHVRVREQKTFESLKKGAEADARELHDMKRIVEQHSATSAYKLAGLKVTIWKHAVDAAYRRRREAEEVFDQATGVQWKDIDASVARVMEEVSDRKRRECYQAVVSDKEKANSHRRRQPIILPDPPGEYTLSPTMTCLVLHREERNRKRKRVDSSEAKELVETATRRSSRTSRGKAAKTFE